MSFATDLLDGFETLYKRTDGVLKNTTETASFLKKLSAVEKEYGKALAKLVSSEKGTFQKSAPAQKELGTTYDAWEILLTELEKIAEHHNSFGDKLENELSKNTTNYHKEKTRVRTKLEGDGKRITRDMRTAHENLQKARSKYVTLSKEADAAEAQHMKGKGDMSMKPAQLAKLAQRSSQAHEKRIQSDNDYQATLNQTNQKQTEFYTSTMPSLLGEFQQWEEDRLKNNKETVERITTLLLEFPGVYSSTAEVAQRAAHSINVDADITVFVRENKTNISAPSDIPYQPYDVDTPGGSNPSSGKPAPGPGPKKPYTPVTGDKFGEREWGLTAGDHSLSPEAKQSKLKTQTGDLDKLIASETKAKEGLENLVRFYAADPVAQKKAEDQLSESEEKLQRLMEAKANVKNQLDGLGAVPGGSVIRVKGLYDYNATCDTELSFKAGDILTIAEQDNSGWWYADLNGKSGFIPNNYVEPL